MLYRNCWALLLLPLCLAFHRQGSDALCGVPAAYGGQPIQNYLDNKSDKLVLPWTVAVRHLLGKFKCLGSIIPENDHGGKQRNSSALVLTAGSCFRHSLSKRWGSPKHYKVYAGLGRLRLFLNRGEKTRAKSVRIVPFNTVNENIWNGVALVTLSKPFVFNKYISPVCLAREYASPPDTSLCFVSTYHWGKLDEDVVKMVPGSVCRFGHFPELAGTRGLCTHHDRSDTEKSLGGPLVCIINGKAHQFGIYLSQLTTKRALASHKQALHYYGHVTTILESRSRDASGLIVLGSVGKSSETVESGGNTAPKPPRGAAPTPPPKEHRPILPPSERPTKPPHGVPARPQPPAQPLPVYCGDTVTFGRTLESYVVGNNAQDMFPWNVIITSRILGSTKCIGSLVHKGDLRQVVNSSDIIITAADCFSMYKQPTVSAKSRLRVYAASPRFSRLRRRGIRAKIADVVLYGLPWQNEQTRAGVAILKLERPLSRKDNVVPVCLAQRESVPPPHGSCYVTHYDKDEHRIDEEVLMVTRNARCLAAQGSNAPLFRGICAIEQRKRNYVQLGSPMVCIVGGRAYQYGVYLNQLSLNINEKVKQNLGFYSEITIVHDVFAGRDVSAALYKVRTPPTPKPKVPVFASSSSSFSESDESHPIPPPERVIPVDPNLPKQPAHTIESESKRERSSSISSSSVDSSSEEASAAQSRGVSSRSSEEIDESLRVITINVKMVKPYLDRWIQYTRSRRANRGPGSVSDSKETGKRPSPVPSSPSTPHVICRYPSQRPIGPPDSNPSDGILICPTPGSAVQVVPLPTPLPTAEYPSSSIEAVGMVILPTLPKYDLTNSTIATHDHILVRDNVIGESAIAQGSSASCTSLSIDGELNSLLPSKSSGEITGNEITDPIPDVYGNLVTTNCTSVGSASQSHHHSIHLPGASGVHIFNVSGSSLQALCTGALYVRPGQAHSDEVVTASRCIPSKAADNYKVYVGSLLPRKMTVEQLGKTLVGVQEVHPSPFYTQYSEYNDLKAMGMTVLKLKHKVKIAEGVESFPLPYSSTGASSEMECYVSGVCQHGMPVRVQYKLLNPTECAERLRHKYLPNVMYCGVGEKELLQHPVGSPLLCRTSGTWTQFGIYDQSVHNVMERVVGYSEKKEPSEITLFVKLEDNDVAKVVSMSASFL